MINIDDYLKENPFEVNELVCSLCAQALNFDTLNTNEQQFHKRPDIREYLLFKIAAIAICHQINWDFLHKALSDRLLCLDFKKMADKLANISAPEIQMWLKGYNRPERIKSSERADLLRDIGRKIRDKWHSDATELLSASKNKIAGEQGFAKQLDFFRAYREDPLRKKTNILIHDLVRFRIIIFNDNEAIEPAVDYHIIRLSLRTGKVFPKYKKVFEYLKEPRHPRARFMNLLRQRVSDALVLTSRFSTATIPDVNNFEWQVGRTICLTNEPICVKSSLENRAVTSTSKKQYKLCPYENFCWALKSDRNWLILKEPGYEKPFY